MRKKSKPPLSFPALVQAFFVEYLTQQRALSPQTVAAYRDAFMLFLGFAEARLGRSSAQITLADITPDLIMAFLDHLERDRHNSVRISVIALWLGHECPATTHQYVEADLAMKERALARLQEPETKLRRYRAPDSLIDFLRTL